MTVDEEHVAALIREGFRGVVLGDGIGLLQAQGLDHYADFETLARYRAEDEKVDWSSIPVDQLNSCDSSLSFFDAAGMRFHLPAFLIAELDGTFHGDIVFHLTCFEYNGMSRFALLSQRQRQAVREYLLLRLSDPGCDFVRPRIERALADYWTEGV